MKKIISSILVFLVAWPLQATTLVTGNSDVPAVLTFNQAVSAKAFNPVTGNIFFGLNEASAGSFSINNFARPITLNQLATAQFAGVDLQSKVIDFMTLANSPNNTNPFLIGVPMNSPGLLNQTTLAVQNTQLNDSGSITSKLSAQLLGVNDTNPVQNGPVVFGISEVAAGVARGIIQNNAGNFIFAAVSPTPNGGFGNINSGIAVLNAILTDPALPNSPSIQINQVAAQPNQTGIKAAKLDPTNAAVRINQDPTIALDRVSLFWDDQLQRLYIGQQLATANMANAGAKSVVVGRLQLNEQGELNFDTFLPNSSLVAGQTDKIVGVINDDTTEFLSAAQVQVMHNSTGPSYLIAQGGNGTITTHPEIGATGTVGNLIWALPLVDRGDFTDPQQGLLANKNAFNAITHRFETPATANADLTTIDDQFALVGAGPLPLEPFTPISGAGSGSGQTTGLPRTSLDVLAVGDAVYVAISSAQTDTDDTGVFYSQAQFDNEGKIVRWTPWAKRAFPFNAFPTVPENKGEVRFISIDPVNGNMTGVEGKNGEAVTITSWNPNQYATPLARLINRNLPGGSLSILDLDQTTRGLAASGPSRYALFGGTNKVIFARTTLSRKQTAPFDIVVDSGPSIFGFHPAPQKLVPYVNNGSVDVTNFLVTDVGDVCILTLEYSRRSPDDIEPNTNYFFAGTNIGLYVFADGTGNGFNANELGAPDFGELNRPPFSNRTWQLVKTIPGAVIDIKTSGSVLYVMTLNTDAQGNIQNRIYRIVYADNIATMFDPSNLNIIAQTQLGNLSQTKSLYGMQIIQMGNSEQLILATNNGLYMSFLTGGVQDALTQDQANWQLIPDSGDILWRGVAGVDTPFPTTVWPFNLTDPTGLKIYNRSQIAQLTGGNTVGNDGITPELSAFNPQDFNSTSKIDSFDPITYFTTDGARRFFIVQPTDLPQVRSTQIIVSPYDTAAYRVGNPTVLSNQALNSVSNFNWLKQLGGTGFFYAGTNSGVVAFE